jgi:hypothetical protein
MNKSCSVCILQLHTVESLIFAVSKSPEHCSSAIPFLPNPKCCLRQQCWWCQKAPLTYPYHSCCRDVVLQLLVGQSVLEGKWLLRFAQAMALVPAFRDEQIPTPRSLTTELNELFEMIMSFVSPNTSLALMLPRLCRLPFELKENIIYFVLNSPGGCILFNSKALVILAKLRSWSEERHRSVVCNGALFARWDVFEQTSYVAGLYDKNVKGSTQIKAEDASWDHVVVKSDDIGITEVAFLTSDSALSVINTSGFVEVLHRPEPTHEKLWITLEVETSPAMMKLA